LVSGREVIVSGSRDETVRIWDARTGQQVGEPLTGHGATVEAVALGSFGGREVIVSGSWDSTVRVWDAGTGQPVGEPFTGHTDTVFAVTVGSVGGNQVIVSGGGDHTVQIWGVGTNATVDIPGAVAALVLTHNGVLYVGTGTALCAVQMPT
jgi:WD40 repeat protein